MKGESMLHRLGTWMGAASLAVQVLVPLVIVLDMQAMRGDAGHARHSAAFLHLRASQSTAPATHSHNQAGTQMHAACSLCLALHAASGALGTAEFVLSPRPAADGGNPAGFSRPSPESVFPASYLSRAPPALG